MTKNIWLCPFVIVLFWISNPGLFASEPWKNKVEPILLQQFELGGPLEFIVLFNTQADLSAAKALPTKKEKGKFVFETLKKNASQTQRNAIAYLQNQKVTFTSFYIVNALFATATFDQLEYLARLPEVKKIHTNTLIQMIEPVDYQEIALKDTSIITWGIKMMEADKVWDLGIKGRDVVIGGADTGFDFSHPGILPKYRGWDAEKQTAAHDYHWHDAVHEISPLHNDSIVAPTNNPCGLNATTPCDDNSHGTHTMGTMVGEDGNNKFGVAPEAKWIGCRNMERGWGSLATYVECFEWFLAPTNGNNENPNPSMAPHVINNSWYCPELEGCNPSNFAMMETAINNLKSAGVVVVVSAGNSGWQGCSSADHPPAIFEHSFSIGATASNDTLAGFSSRGPITIDGSNRLKPNVTAPGVDVLSTIPGGRYASFSGTSMAGPHAAAAAALVISANPALAGQVEIIETILEETAEPKTAEGICGDIPNDQVPNHLYGFGRINVLRAVQRALDYTNAVDPVEPEQVIKVYPNPCQDRLYVSFPEAFGSIDLRWFTSDGKEIFRNRLNPAHAATGEEINVTTFPKGLILYRAIVGEKVYTGKIFRI